MKKQLSKWQTATFWICQLKITFATGFISKHRNNGYYSVYITNLHLMEKQIPHGDENNPLIKELLNKRMTSQVLLMLSTTLKICLHCIFIQSLV